MMGELGKYAQDKFKSTFDMSTLKTFYVEEKDTGSESGR
jgi:hypothetical protein